MDPEDIVILGIIGIWLYGVWQRRSTPLCGTISPSGCNPQAGGKTECRNQGKGIWIGGKQYCIPCSMLKTGITGCKNWSNACANAGDTCNSILAHPSISCTNVLIGKNSGGQLERGCLVTTKAQKVALQCGGTLCVPKGMPISSLNALLATQQGSCFNGGATTGNGSKIDQNIAPNIQKILAQSMLQNSTSYWYGNQQIFVGTWKSRDGTVIQTRMDPFGNAIAGALPSHTCGGNAYFCSTVNTSCTNLVENLTSGNTE
jgi:hypothetical protein